jgi:septation ring formation regulator EzrA
MSLISVIFDSIISNIFNSLWIVAWIIYINHATGIYTDITKLTTDAYTTNKIINDYIDKNKIDEKIQKMQKEIKKLSKKMSKISNMYSEISENVASLNNTVDVIEDDLCRCSEQIWRQKFNH